jgi:hypothetical protein
MIQVKDIFKRLIEEEDAALDQWITVLVLAILAIIIFLALKRPIATMLNGAVGEVGNQTNGLFSNNTEGTAAVPPVR